MRKKYSTPPIVVIGASGFVGSHFLVLSQAKKNSLIAPSHTQLNITNKEMVLTFIKKTKPELIINFAAVTNIEDCEKERGDISATTWKLNVNGVKNLAEASQQINAFLIQISTDAVFPGTKKYPGPYAENAKTAKDEKTINWYGVTKKQAEEEVKKLKKNYAIIRISHPFGNPNHKRDLITKTLIDIERKHALFKDQFFTPTFIEDLTKAIWTIHQKKICGVFHVGCKGLVARITFDKYLLTLLKKKGATHAGSMEEFLKYSAPRTQLGGFLTAHTEKTLGLTFHTWQEALQKSIKPNFNNAE